MLEKQVESYLREQVRKHGGECYKWTGTMGAPDRIVFLPGGVVKFVEVKTTDGKVSKIQKVIHKRLADLGTEVVVVWNKGDVDEFIGSI